MAKIIVSYDDTDNDRDALALGRILGELGGDISLAYVRHTQQPDSAREALEEKEAEELLEHGAEALGDEKTPRHVVVHASTGAGLWELAEREKADVIVFGSDYRTAKGAVMPGTSAQRMLTGGPVAVAIAPAGFRSQAGRDQDHRRAGRRGRRRRRLRDRQEPGRCARRHRRRPARGHRPAGRRLLAGVAEGPRQPERPGRLRDRDRQHARARGRPRHRG